MVKIGVIREGKIPGDTRVALTPAQCKWLSKHRRNVVVKVQSAAHRCFSDDEYRLAGIEIADDVSDCDVLLGIKEVPVHMLVPDKTYLFFSHTKKMQPHNRHLLQEIIRKKITLIDYECLEHEDGSRIIGFGFFAGVVGAHNGVMAYGNRSGAFTLPRVHATKSLSKLIHHYFGLRLPNLKIAVTGTGRVAHGVLEIMNLMGVTEVEPDDYVERQFAYPVYVHLKGADLYKHKEMGVYTRKIFHEHPSQFECVFERYIPHTDILMNGVYWQADIPRLFQIEAVSKANFRIQTIADITDDYHGSVPCNLGDSTIENPVYGVDKISFVKTAPYLPGSVDVMAVGNLPNELPRDASRYFGQQLIKHVLAHLMDSGHPMIDGATIVKNGKLNGPFVYMREYAEGK